MKLHLGCGQRFIPGFVHVDVVPWPHIDVVHSVDSIPMITDASVDLIYSSHVLEHFDQREIPRVLKEWYRILRPGGVLRVAVPDFDAVAAVYSSRKNLPEVLGLIFGRGDYLYNIHRTIFDYANLRDVLEDAGFRNIRLYDWRMTEHAGIDDYSQAYIPHMDKENGTLMSLNVEAIRP